MAKQKLPIEVSVVGTAAYAWLDKPDVKFAKAGEAGKYKLTLVVDKTKVEGLKARINGGSEVITGTEWISRMLRAHKDAGGDPSNAPIKDGDKPVGKGGQAKAVNEEFVGKWLVNFKSGFKPQAIDTKKVDLPENIIIMSGDEVKVAFRPNLFDGGCNLYMNAVMLIAKNAGGSSGGGGAGAFGDDEEGYVADASTTDVFGGDEDDVVTKVTSGDY